MNSRENKTAVGRWFSLLLALLVLPLFVCAQSQKPESKKPEPKPAAPHAAPQHTAPPRPSAPPTNPPRGNEPRGGEARGNTAHGNATHSNEVRGPEAHANATHGNEVRSGQPQINTPRGNEVRGADSRGNEVRGPESHANATHGNEVRSGQPQINAPRGNEVRGAESRVNAPRGNEVRGGESRGTMVRSGRSVNRPDGSVYHFNDRGARTSVRTRTGAEAHFNSRGHLTSIRAHDITINRGVHGERRFETRRADGARLVGYGRDHGYIERGYVRGGRPYIRRTYYYGGRRYAYAYRGAYWHGVAYYGYVPRYYYGRAFYGWAYNPWPAPIVWGWGWGAAPWYGYYGAYFAPAPVYASPSLWLADYLIAANLQAAYEARAAANANAQAAAAAESAAADSEPDDQPVADNNGPVTLTPEVKQAIADEVRAQIEAEKQEATNPNPQPASSDQIPAALDPAHRTFVVSTVLNPEMADGTECSLSPGDVLTRIQDAPDANQNVTVLVSSSQSGDCASGAQVPVAVQDLQDMQNDFRAKIDEGLNQMAENQGKNGMPGGPAAARRASPDGQVQADANVADDLKAQQDAARQAEQDVKQASSGDGSGGND